MTLQVVQNIDKTAVQEIGIFKSPENGQRDFQAFECYTKGRKVLELKN